MKKIFKAIEKAFFTVESLLVLWGVHSVIDVIANQSNGGTDAWWNLFNLF
jgi:hypothetical protein